MTKENMESEFSFSRRSTPLQLFISAFALFVACFHLWVAIYPEVSELGRNAFHFGSFALLATLTYPLFGDEKRSNKLLLCCDLLLGISTLVSTIYLVLASTRIANTGNLNFLDWTASMICIVAAIELSRRVAGVIIPILVILGLSYIALWGKNVSGMFHFAGLSWKTVTLGSMYNDEGIFGNITRISSTYIFLFIIFGAFLLRSGASDFIIGFAKAIAGKIIGGPGIIAVIASGLTGTIMGSAVANTASTGVVTVPLMKKLVLNLLFPRVLRQLAQPEVSLCPH